MTYQHTEAADVFTDEEIVQKAVEAKERAEAVESESSPSRWEEADCYKALSDRGWSQRKIAEECGTSQTTVSLFIQCAKHDYLGNRPSFWEAYKDVRSDKGESTAHVSHNAGENEWYTPEEFIAAAREVMGRIDLDPASTEVANEIVQASLFYTSEDNGLDYEWSGRVWMNPPYAQPLIGQFCEMLASSVESNSVTEACVLVNNATETKWFQRLTDSASACCFPAGRVKFWHPDRESAPLQGQAVVYHGENADTFCAEFGRLGIVLRRDRR